MKLSLEELWLGVQFGESYGEYASRVATVSPVHFCNPTMRLGILVNVESKNLNIRAILFLLVQLF